MLCNSWICSLSIRGWVGCWVQEQKAEHFLRPSHPFVLPTAWPAHGGRPEASQLGTAVVCDLPPALTPRAESRGVPAGCNVPGVLIPAAGKLPPYAASHQSEASTGDAGRTPACRCRTSLEGGKPCQKLRHRQGRGVVLSPPPPHPSAVSWEKQRNGEISHRTSAGLPWLDAGSSEQKYRPLEINTA